MFFTLLGLIAASLFGVFFGSDGELPSHLQDAVFVGLIVAGALLNGLQIPYQGLCQARQRWFCPTHD